MREQLRRMAEVFANVAKDEDEELSKLCGQGIFFMPELAFAYACGKAVMKEKDRIFGDQPVEWLREIDLRVGGPSDLVFKLPAYQIVVEFKMRAKLEQYLADIEKLRRLKPEKFERVFCVLLDPFTNKTPDTRVEEIETSAGGELVRLLDPFPCFETKQMWYKSEVSCLVAVWAIRGVGAS